MLLVAIVPLLASCAVAYPHHGYDYPTSYQEVPVRVVSSGHPDDTTYTATQVDGPTGSVKQQTSVGKDVLGGHSIRHSAHASNVDPHSGQTDVKHDEHEFHINPYKGEAAVHTNNAEGSLNPSVGKAAFTQKRHEAKIAPGHASVADAEDTAEVSSHGSGASRDVKAARTDVVHDGVAKNAHQSHKSYASLHGIGGKSKAAETNQHSFEGHGHGKVHIDSREADEAYDHLGHAAANEAGYKLDQAYDARVNLGASNELQYSRHASHDPHGSYAAVTQTKQSSHGGKLVPVKEVAYAVPVKEVAYAVPVKEAVVAYAAPVKEVSYAPMKEVIYGETQYGNIPVSYDQTHVYGESLPVTYEKQSAMVYGEPVSYQKSAYAYSEPVSYQKQVYEEPVPVSYRKQVYEEPVPVSYRKQVYEEPVPVSYRRSSALVHSERAPVVYNRSYGRVAPYAPQYDNEEYYY